MDGRTEEDERASERASALVRSRHGRENILRPQLGDGQSQKRSSLEPNATFVLDLVHSTYIRSEEQERSTWCSLAILEAATSGCSSPPATRPQANTTSVDGFNETLGVALSNLLFEQEQREKRDCCVVVDTSRNASSSASLIGEDAEGVREIPTGGTEPTSPTPTPDEYLSVDERSPRGARLSHIVGYVLYSK